MSGKLGQVNDVQSNLGLCPGDQGWPERLGSVTETEITRRGGHSGIRVGVL